MQSQGETMKTFKTSREIPASPENIFAAISNPERLARWWGPAGFTNTFNKFEFTIGGKWFFVMHGPNGANYENESEFSDIAPSERVVIYHISEPKFILTISINQSARGSLVDWNQEFESEQIAMNIAHIVVPSNEQNLDRLTAEVCGNNSN